VIRFLLRWLGRALIGLALVVLLLVTPVLWVEGLCRSGLTADPYKPLLTDPAWQRPESRTLLTYPEWHIVHAYEDYATVIASGDPHDFGYLRSIWGFWDSLCTLSRQTGSHGGFPWETKQMVYTIGVSFSLELGLKALYEETIGRAFAALRGPARAPLDDLSAAQAAAYASFLQQTPWYRWDFTADAAALDAAATPLWRDRERARAVGLEYRTKARYAKLIAAAVAGVGADELTLRAIVTGLSPDRLAALPGVRVIQTRPEGVEIETPRYRAFTLLAQTIATDGGRFVEIAGNDDILFTALSPEPWEDGEMFQMQRQGPPGQPADYRHLMLVKVADLANALNALPGRGLTLEQVHDY
jgi:hypothetical protein